jgi:hypothetical protein
MVRYRPDGRKIDTSYANYLRLAGLNLISADNQLTSNDWNWLDMDGKAGEIERLMNLAEVRDRPESGGVVAW